MSQGWFAHSVSYSEIRDSLGDLDVLGDWEGFHEPVVCGRNDVFPVLIADLGVRGVYVHTVSVADTDTASYVSCIVSAILAQFCWGWGRWSTNT